jgi:hypothetical protein
LSGFLLDTNVVSMHAPSREASLVFLDRLERMAHSMAPDEAIGMS